MAVLRPAASSTTAPASWPTRGNTVVAVYLAVLRAAAGSATAPAYCAAVWTYDSANGQTTVTSHVRASPACHGINVKPSGRFSSDRHTATGSSHMPYRITRCYLPPDRGDIPAFTLAEAGIRLSDPGGMQGCVDLAGWLQTETVYPPEDGHPSRY